MLKKLNSWLNEPVYVLKKAKDGYNLSKSQKVKIIKLPSKNISSVKKKFYKKYKNKKILMVKRDNTESRERVNYEKKSGLKFYKVFYITII